MIRFSGKTYKGGIEVRGRKKKAFARILCFILSVLLSVPAFSMPEARAEVFYCTECEEYKDCDHCQFCTRCEDCVEICDRCGEVCLECHEMLESVDEYEPCADCGRCKEGVAYCIICGRCEDCVELCEECGEVCTECHEETAGGSADERVPCPGCYRCKAGGLFFCSECGYCEDCKELCTDCGYCLECAFDMDLHCEECESCYYVVGRCESGGEHCTDCCDLCENCGECLIATDSERCDYCGYCETCCEENACDACGMCAMESEFEEHFCEECGACLEVEAERCWECGLCENCCREKAEDMGCFCDDGCWMDLEESHFCADCGKCFGEAAICEICLSAGEYRCTECCRELARMQGCDCETYVCVNDPIFTAHMASVHEGVIVAHAKTPKSAWSMDETYHWHDCRLCDSAAHISDKSQHFYNSMGICITCGFNKTSRIVITSQPKDRYGKPTYDGWVSDHYDADKAELASDNTVTFSVAAYGKDAKKGLQYQWYRDGVALLDEDSGNSEYYVSGANTARLTFGVPFDGCGLSYKFHCVITDEYGNKATSQNAYLRVTHDCRVFDKDCTSNEKGHTFRCVGGGCDVFSKIKPHEFGEYEWARKADGTQDYLYRACTVCGWREKFEAHEHVFDFGTMYSIPYDDLTVIKEDDKHHVYEYEYEYNGKTMRAGSNVNTHFVQCSYPGCHFVQKEEHEWGGWRVVNNATEDKPGGLYRKCNVCGMEQTWAKQGYKWHVHPVDVTNGRAKKIDPQLLALAGQSLDQKQISKLMDQIGAPEDLDFAEEGDVVLILPDPVLDKKVTGAKVTIDYKMGVSDKTYTETLEVTELIPGQAYVFTVPTSGRKQIGKTLAKIDYEANFIHAQFLYQNCDHVKTKTKGVVAATCTEIGYTGDKVCAYCEHLIKKGEFTAPAGHGNAIPAKENVPALNVKGEQIYSYSRADDREYPVYLAHVAQEISCDDNSMRGSYTGDLVCEKCGEVVQKGKYYEKTHHFVLYNDCDDATKKELDRMGCKPYAAPEKGKDGYSGDSICSVCGKISLGHTLQMQMVTKVFIELNEMPVYGSKVKYDAFSFGSGTDHADEQYYLSWFGYDDGSGEYEWFRPDEVINEKVLPECMKFDLRIKATDGGAFSDQLQLFVNGKLYPDVRNYGTENDQGTIIWTSIDVADTGFCGVAYDVNGGEGNIPCPAVERGTVVSLADCSFTAPAGKQFDHWEIDGRSFKPGDTVTVNGLVVAKAIWKEAEARVPADIDAVATNLDGKVGLLFYVTMPDYVLADEGAYAVLTLNTKDGDMTETQLVKNAPHSPKGSLDRWQFSYYVVAKQMHDKITLNLYLSDGTRVPLTRKGEAVAETGYAYSVIDYCDLAIANSSNAKMVTLAKRLKAYGEMAQIYFNYRAEGLVPDADFEKDLFGGLAAYAEVTSGECPAGLVSSKPQGMVLILEEETTLRVNWKFETGADPNSYEYMIDDAPATLQHAGSDYFLAVKNISSKKLGDAHKFTISKDGKSYTWTGSALTWANTAVNKGGANAKNMGKALYLYNQAARDYFNY